MIEYQGIKFLTVDQLIEYKVKAEGFIKPTPGPTITLAPGIFVDPLPLYLRQHDPWIHKGPSSPFPGSYPWHPPLSPSCLDDTGWAINCNSAKIET